MLIRKALKDLHLLYFWKNEKFKSLSPCGTLRYRKPTMNDYDERKNANQQMKATINQKLLESGERDKLKELLRQRLIECGWRDQLKVHCKDIVRQKGLENITVDDLVAEITPKGRALVPDPVKKELLQRIRTFLAQQSNM